mmetsp:Transcript_12581/g.44044  ORF Transcript_12581/g.44044 Transcript_12581/m.44044 type:complete len:350 (-) Transcript_12581:375-1424(-)
MSASAVVLLSAVSGEPASLDFAPHGLPPAGALQLAASLGLAGLSKAGAKSASSSSPARAGVFGGRGRGGGAGTGGPYSSGTVASGSMMRGGAGGSGRAKGAGSGKEERDVKVSRPVGSMLTHTSPEMVRARARDTIIIMDWDDTLLASSWLASHGLRLDSPSVPRSIMAQLEQLEESVLTLLWRAAECGRVVVVTNAETGWVELSAQKFMPRVLPALEEAGVRVVSARSTFEPAFPDSPCDWKVQAFHEEVRAAVEEKRGDRVLHAISLGDSIHERQAIHQVMHGLPASRTKSVKFVERPTASQLRRQVDCLAGCIEHLTLEDDHLDIMLNIQSLTAELAAVAASAVRA